MQRIYTFIRHNSITSHNEKNPHQQAKLSLNTFDLILFYITVYSNYFFTSITVYKILTQ